MRALAVTGSSPLGRWVPPVLAAAFVMIRVAEARSLAPPWLSSYGDDLLCLPLVLSGVLAAHRLVRRDHGTLPAAHGLAALVVFSVYFELVLPAAGTGAVADPLDVLMYLAGFLAFQLFINRGEPGRPAGRTGPADQSSGKISAPNLSRDMMARPTLLL